MLLLIPLKLSAKVPTQGKSSAAASLSPPPAPECFAEDACWVDEPIVWIRCCRTSVVCAGNARAPAEMGGKKEQFFFLKKMLKIRVMTFVETSGV